MSQPSLPKLDQFRRIVVKVGSSLLVDRQKGEVKRDWLNSLADDLAALHRRGADVLVVSSGSVALGRAVLKLPPGALKLEDSQAAAAVGQIALARTWAETLGARGIVAGQILVTFGDTEERRRYLNARETLGRLLDMRAAPIINENDTVATTEIRYGDNDRLAARVATMASADLLILLSDVEGLYDAPPAGNPDARLIPLVTRVTAEIEAMAGGAASELSRGGMRTKIEAAKIAVTGGAHMAIADGRLAHPVARIGEGRRARGSCRRPRRSRRARNGSPVRLSRRARCMSMKAPRARSSAAPVCCRPACAAPTARSRAAIASLSATPKAARSAAASSATTLLTRRKSSA